MSGLGHSVRQWVKTQDSRGGRRRHAGRQASGAVQGSCFSPCMGWELAGARGRGAARCLLFTRRQAPAAAMPPCVWRWHTGLPAGRGPGKGQPAHPSIPSVRRSIARQQQETIQKPITLSLSHLPSHTSLLSSLGSQLKLPISPPLSLSPVACLV